MDEEKRDGPSDLRTDERFQDFLRQAEQGGEGNLQYQTKLIIKFETLCFWIIHVNYFINRETSHAK